MIFKFRINFILLCSLSITILQLSSMVQAGPSSQIIVSEKSLSVSDGFEDLVGDRDEFLKKYTTPKDQTLGLLIASANESFYIEMAFEREIFPATRLQDRETFNKAFASYKERFPAILKSHLEETLAKYPHSIEEKFGAKIYTIPQGVEFWIDLVTHPDPERRAAGIAFLGRPYKEDFGGLPATFIDSVLSDFHRSTRLMRSDLFNTSEWSQILKLAKNEGYLMSRYGNYILLGSGLSYLIANDIFRSAEELKDPVLQKRFTEVTEFLAYRGIDIQVDEHQGAAAFYSPDEKRMAYVMPSRGDLDTHTHEGTHARFDRFQENFRRWTERKGFAVPYEIDGPALGLGLGFGGFMNLLNELNSWRIGTSFSTPMTDAEILKLLRDSYGRQAGKESAELFGTLWTPEVINSRAVPKIILSATRALNKMTNEALVLYGQESLVQKDEVKQHNFSRLAYVRFKKKELPHDVQIILESIITQGVTDGTRQFAKGVLESLLNPMEADSSSSKKTKEFWKTVEAWLSTLQNDRIKVVPMEYSYSYRATFYFAVTNNILNYEKVIEELGKVLGEKQAQIDEKEKTIFTQILAESGDTFAEKFNRHLENINNQGFPMLWNDFLKGPTYDVLHLLAEHHTKEFKSEHLLELLKISLDQKKNEYDQKKALDLLTSVYEKNSFETIWDENDFHKLVQRQKSMNKSNGKSDDFALPQKRSAQPGSWLVDSMIDQFLVEHMFDGNPGTYRIDLINFIRSHTFPSELPRLKNRIIQLLISDDKTIPKEDLWVARMFMVAEKSFMYQSHLVWPQVIAEAVFKDSTPSVSALEFGSEYYRLFVARVLKVSDRFNVEKGIMDRQVRMDTIKIMKNLSARDQGLLESAIHHLWRILGHENERVRKAARYALGSNPIFLLAVEDKIERAVQSRTSPYRTEAFHLIAFTQPGFFPMIDHLIKKTQSSIKTLEQQILDLRRPPDERLLDDSSSKIQTIKPILCNQALSSKVGNL